MAAECDVVALREFVPAATAPLTVAGAEDRRVLLGTLLPMAAPALVRPDGAIWLGLQVQHMHGDPARDLGAVLESALQAEPGEMVGLPDDPGEGPRLQDLVLDQPLEVTVHEGFEFWIADLEDDPAVAASLESANATVSPTAKLASVPSAYWTRMGGREYLRWVMPQDEDLLLDAFARLHIAGRDGLVEGSRLIGMFRTQGLLVPVWEMAPGSGPEVLEEPTKVLAEHLAEALDDASALTAEERSARAGLANRQVTIR